MSSKYRHLYQFCYVKIFSTNHNRNLALLDYPGRVRSQITSVVCQIQRFDFDCNLVVTRKVLIWTGSALRTKPLYSCTAVRCTCRGYSWGCCASASKWGVVLKSISTPPFSRRWEHFSKIGLRGCTRNCSRSATMEADFLEMFSPSKVHVRIIRVHYFCRIFTEKTMKLLLYRSI